MTDRELLDQLRRDRSDTAFTELVRRHIDLVHSAALRQLGDADAARDLTQQVFIELARQAGRLPAAVILSGWLYRTTRHLCLETLRRDRRRREREHTAAAQLMNDATAHPWEQVAPALEPAMDELGETDRQAILLRYFENRSLREVGAALGLGEDAAQKRVSRALDRLRDIFSRRGVSLSATALAGSLSAGAVQAAPAGLAVTISTAALGGAAVAAATTLATEGASTAMNLINLKTAVAILGAAAVTGTATYVVQEREADQLRTENTALNQTHAKLASDQQEALAMIQLRDEQIERLKRDVADLPRLRGEIDATRRKLAELDSLRIENQTLREAINRLHLARNSTPDASLEELESLIDQKKYEEVTELRVLGMLLVMYADDNNGMLPTDLSSGGPMAPYYAGTLKEGALLTDRLDMNAYEVVVTGNINQLPVPSRTIIARQKTPTFRSGSFQRLYVFADGHTEYGWATTLMELDAWERQRSAPVANQ